MFYYINFLPKLIILKTDNIVLFKHIVIVNE